MPLIKRMTIGEGTNYLSITRSNDSIVNLTKASVDAWLAANSTATATQVETNLQTTINSSGINTEVNVYVHVYSKSPLTFTVLLAKPGTVVTGTWWQ